ncbi:hypothetical protein AB0G15_05970 [Streptosporangium sp. NPDC023825]|uniref:hypothetical protein n=1 Tax=Streptosporangium sp. NPDC023825 TaxID=3154909 RepID=UPI0034187E54
MAGEYHFTFYARRQVSETLIRKRDGSPIPMAGWSARMQCRDRPGGRLMTTFSTEDGSIVLGESDGTVTLVKSDEDTDWVGWLHGVYELVMIKPDGQDLPPILRGTYSVVPAVTQ